MLLKKNEGCWYKKITPYWELFELKNGMTFLKCSTSIITIPSLNLSWNVFCLVIDCIVSDMKYLFNGRELAYLKGYFLCEKLLTE